MCSASQEIRVTRFAQRTINPLVCCICWAGFLGRVVFPPWNEGPNFGSYSFIKKRSSWAVIRKLPGEGGRWMEEAWEQVLSWLAVRDVRKNSFVLNRCIVLGSHEIWFLFKFTIWDSTLCYVIWQDCCCQARRRVEKPTWILRWCPNGHDSMVCSWGPGDTHHLPWR